ncbi:MULTISPECIES: recombination-associated protein RdgC [Alteromonas]|jgi:recombination associated protein RdgC|uniref:Recombination-associated protein RdgC n=2 Tax=Alteromonas stellipolaris TaxID=233316 RepID=A0AAW7Z075_9ALTE|nr:MULTISPECIES: recombination-associated protein RdgC [Alteromonas]AMJ89647.1 recombination-associated protein RdgC [Alteromonas sp. Mac2]ALM91804.1 DNA recombination-dependent growth factor C [Alteromonas stellipolaris LMG 21856]AMJ73345.1 recombination-associated protein RdgC [Alteromonas stellipolaris]AMJ85787.1 recombination-associated protein RdgC [Alteromonas sp. Mac1]AMJ93462.1 recombination-associated protein RdgC [Alteromonas stellipolaris]
MWFKNIKAYQITQPLSLDDGDLERVLSEQAFRPCKSQDLATMGFASPFSQAGKQGTMFQRVGQRYWLTVKKQEKLLPAAVINAELDDMVAKIEMETGSPVGKKAKADLKQEIQTRLLPQAFTKNTYTHGFISLEDNLVAVDASADGKAEAFLALVRKAIGSLPVVPLARHSLQSELTHWLTDSAPDGIALLEEAEFKSTDDAGSIIRCKNQPLDSDEITIHLDAGKLVQKVAFEYQDTLTAVIAEDGSLKRIKFTDRLKEETEDIPKDQVEARLDAEFALMSAELCTLLNFLRETLNLNDANT